MEVGARPGITALVMAACSGGSAAATPGVARRRRGRAEPRHLVRLRGARPTSTRSTTGSLRSRRRPAARSRRRSGRLEQRRAAHAIRGVRRWLVLRQCDQPADGRAAIVAPVNTALIPNYANIFEGLKNKAHNSLDGVPYGVPHGRGPNLLMYNTEVGRGADDVGWLWEKAARTGARSASTTRRSTSPTRRCASRRRSRTSGSRTRIS